VGLFQDMRDRGVWTAYQRYVVALEPIFERTSERGVPVSPARHAEVVVELDTRIATLFDSIQTTVPEAAKAMRVCKRKPSYRLPFKPSTPALVRYMNLRGHPVPQHFKTNKPTTQEDELRRLARNTRDPLYPLVLDYRDAKTMRTNHVHNWTPDADGRVHPIFYATATGQMEARRPNVMNAPHHKPTQGDLFRSMVQAAPDHTLLSFDYKGFHALYLAHESGDKAFERLVRMDVHSYLTAHFLRLAHADEALSWPDAQLREYLRGVKAEHKAVRNAKVKHALLGYNNGMGYRKLFAQYRDFFDKQADAKRLLELMDVLFPLATTFRRNIVEQAHEQGYLMSRFGCIRYFWEVKSWRGGPDPWSHGDDAEAAISFIQQNHAHCHLKDVMLRLAAAGWLERARFIMPIHDDLTFECPDSILDEARGGIYSEMVAPNATSGLAVDVETKQGKQWNLMREVQT
jgi:hypothetical protein